MKWATSWRTLKAETIFIDQGFLGIDYARMVQEAQPKFLKEIIAVGERATGARTLGEVLSPVDRAARAEAEARERAVDPRVLRDYPLRLWNNG